MLFRQLFDAASSTYTYLLADPISREAVLIDTVFEQHVRDLALLRELGLKLVATLDTHVHADHVTGAWLMHSATGSKIALSKRAGADGVELALEAGDRIKFGAYTLEVRATPGHTDGCLTFVLSDKSMAFTGDALLIRAAGRTDFQQGSAHTLFESITQQIFSLPDDCLLYPGHDYSGRTVTSVMEEKRHNPRVGGGANERDFVGYMENLHLPHPRQIDVAVPANMRCGKPEVVPTRSEAMSAIPVMVSYAGVPEIDPLWVHEHLQEVLVVDVRDEAELYGILGVIPGSVHVPLGELRTRAAELPKLAKDAAKERGHEGTDEKLPEVEVCRSGRRSAQATNILRSLGQTDVANISGGMLRWNDRSLPTTSLSASE